MPDASRSPALNGTSFLILATVAQVGVSLLQQGLNVLSYALGGIAHLTLTQTGSLVSAVSFGMMAAMLLSGPVVDKYGVRPALAVCGVLELAAALFLVHQHTYAGLLMALAFVGFTVGATPVAGARAIFERFAGARRGLAMGIRQSGVPVGAAIAAAVLPVWALHMGAFSPWIPLAIVALVLNLALAMASGSTAHRAGKAVTAHLNQDLRRLALPSVVSLLLASGQYALLTYTVASAPPGPQRAVAGIFLAVAQIGGALGRVVLGHVSDRWHRRPEVVGLAALVGAGGIALSPHLGNAPFWLIVVSYLITGVGVMGCNALMLTWAAERISPERSASAIALIATSVYAGAVIFPPLIGLLASYTGFSDSWYWVAVLTAIAALLTFSAHSKGPAVERSPAAAPD